jgi:hypothetical protein
LIAGWISGEDLKGPEVVSLGDCRDALRGFEWVITASADNICPWRIFAMNRVAALLLSLGLAKLVRGNLICVPMQSYSL